MEAPSAKIPKSLKGLRKWLHDLWMFCLQNQIITSDDYDPHQSSRGTQLILRKRAGSGGGSSADDRTWFVHIVNTATSGPPAWKRGVDLLSPLQESVDPNDIVFPAGILDDEDLSKATGFVPTADGDFIWAEIEFDYTNPDNPFTLGSFAVKSLTNGDSYKGRGIYINLGTEDSPQYAQWKLCIPAASIENDPAITAPTPRVKLRYLKTPIRLVARSFTMFDSDGEDPKDVGGMDYEA